MRWCSALSLSLSLSLSAIKVALHENVQVEIVHGREGNVHDFVILFRAMSTNPVDNVHDFVVLFRAMFPNPVDNIHDFVVLFHVMSTSFWF